MPKRTTPAVRSVNTATPARRRPNILSSATPKLPHEQDQSVGMTDGIPSATVQQDTDRGPEAQRAYQKLKK